MKVYYSLRLLLENTEVPYDGVLASHFMTQAGIKQLLTDMGAKAALDANPERDADASDVRL